MEKNANTSKKHSNWWRAFAGRGGAAGAKFRISLACPVGAVMNCADNTGRDYYHVAGANVLMMLTDPDSCPVGAVMNCADNTGRDY